VRRGRRQRGGNRREGVGEGSTGSDNFEARTERVKRGYLVFNGTCGAFRKNFHSHFGRSEVGSNPSKMSAIYSGPE
jgi:hypothetical protein